VTDNLDAFLRVLDPADNSTGGGAASALAGAMAAALAAMVARLSLGRPGLEPEAFYRDIAAQGQDLATGLMAGGQEDCLAFDAVRAAYGLPRQTEEQKAARREAIDKALLQASLVPLKNAEQCGRVLELARQLEGRSNPRAGSDLECAFFLARAGLQGCLANVKINLPGLRDQAQAEEIKKRAAELSRADEGV